MFSIRIVSKDKETTNSNKVRGIPCPFPPLEHELTRKANGAQNGDRKLLERKFERQNREKRFNRIEKHENSTYVLRLAGLETSTRTGKEEKSIARALGENFGIK